MGDVCQWQLQFTFRDDRRCKKFIKKLLKLPFVLKTTYSSYWDGQHTQYQIEIEGSWAKTLKQMAKMIEKVDYSTETKSKLSRKNT